MRGELDAASAFFEEAEAVAEEIRRISPDDVYLLRSQVGAAGKYACELERERGDFERAMASCRRSLDALEHAFSLEPNHMHKHHDLGSVLEFAARAALGGRQLEVAKSQAEASVQAARLVLEKEPAQTLRLAIALRTRAEVAKTIGEAHDGFVSEARALAAKSSDTVASAALLTELDAL